MKEEVKLIPIDKIRVINPRHREQKKFQAIVQSIKNLGLKKPIKVSLRTAEEGDTCHSGRRFQGRPAFDEPRGKYGTTFSCFAGPDR
jgi:hypothetical protein